MSCRRAQQLPPCVRACALTCALRLRLDSRVRACMCASLLLLLQVETEGDVATAFTLARILSNIPPSRGGPTSIVIFDIHALQVRPAARRRAGR